MGCGISTGNNRIDSIAREEPSHDIWSKLIEGADGVTQTLLFKWIDHQRSVARKLALKDHLHAPLLGDLRLDDIGANFLDSHKYILEVHVQDHVSTTVASDNVETPKWRERFTFPVNGKGVEVHFKIFKEGGLHVLPLATGTWDVTAERSKRSVSTSVELHRPFLIGSESVGSIRFTYKFTPKLVKAIKNRGFFYATYLPVLDPDVPLPALAKPDKAFNKQDDMMQDTMKAIAIDWMVTGAINTRKTLPIPLTDRVDGGEGDEWFTHRRLNGSNPGYIKANAQKTAENNWDYEIEFDFRTSLDPAKHLKSGITFPLYCCARFSLSLDGKTLVPHSILHGSLGKPITVQPSDGSVGWKHAKELYKTFEVNTRFTYSHVAVHFNVEQYAMALYRNLSEGHPIWQLLTPHFKNVITNNRKVVRPKPDGVVTMADVYTFDGQIALLQDKFSKFSFKTVPKRVLPTTLEGNDFENAQEVMWGMLTTYVEEFFAEHPEITIDEEIQAMSRDLQEHSLNKAPGAMEITDLADLKQLCLYVIFQAIFFHAWVHWNGYDDFTPVLKYDPDSSEAPSKKEQAELENKSNMIQTFVTFMSPTLKQWPILDPELGGNERLRQLLMQNAPQINPAIQVATLIMAPNT